MLSNLLTTSLPVLTLSAQKHNVLNGTMMDQISEMMMREDWTCHACGVQLPGLMEVDHLKGHNPSGKNGIRPICQFCHDRKHPVWAASRGRLSLIHAPDLGYDEISQITWALIQHDGDDGFGYDRKRLQRDLDARREDAFDAIGHTNIESIFEAILAFRDRRGEDECRALLDEMDQHLRIVPSCLFDGSPEIQVWGQGGFNMLPEGWEGRSRPPGLPGMDVMRAAGGALKARL